jgi:disulfide bond formation protein DsbB
LPDRYSVPSKRQHLFVLPLALAAALAVGCGGGGGGGGEANAEAVAAGTKVFQTTCATCHGADANGLPKLGKGLRNNAYVAERSDEEMLAFLKTGRPASDPLNTTGVDMPPRGGNPALTDQDLLNVVAYVRTLK